MSQRSTHGLAAQDLGAHVLDLYLRLAPGNTGQADELSEVLDERVLVEVLEHEGPRSVRA